MTVQVGKPIHETASITERFDFLYKMLETALSQAARTERSKVDLFWSQWTDFVAGFSFFDDRYYFGILKNYENYALANGTKTRCDVILPIMFQMWAGKGKSFFESARAARIELRKFGTPDDLVEFICETICSLGDIDYGKYGQVELLSNLQLCRNALPFHYFIKNQCRLQEDAIFYTKLEFYGIQHKIFSQLLKKSIFTNFWFYQKFEEEASVNITRYCKILSGKIETLKVAAEISKREAPKLHRPAFKLMQNPDDVATSLKRVCDCEMPHPGYFESFNEVWICGNCNFEIQDENKTIEESCQHLSRSVDPIDSSERCIRCKKQVKPDEIQIENEHYSA